MSAQQQHTSLAEHRAIKRLASLVGDVVARLEQPGGGELGGMLHECNAELESYLELCRESPKDGERDDLVNTAKDDLHRLCKLLTLVERADAPFVMRQIRRVLSRFDFCLAR